MISVKKKNGIDANSNPNPIATGIKHLPALSEGRQQLKPINPPMMNSVDKANTTYVNIFNRPYDKGE